MSKLNPYLGFDIAELYKGQTYRSQRSIREIMAAGTNTLEYAMMVDILIQGEQVENIFPPQPTATEMNAFLLDLVNTPESIRKLFNNFKAKHPEHGPKARDCTRYKKIPLSMRRHIVQD